MSRTDKLLAELVALPSVNPAFLPGGHPDAGEQRVAEFLAATAARAGLEVDLVPVLPGRPNLIARLRPAGSVRQTILLAPHLDTVVAEPGQFVPRRRNGRLYGRGACDTKGSVAAMLDALLELARQPGRPQHTEIIFAGLADEENWQAGSRALVESGLRADLAIVGEPTRLQAVTAHKGSVWLELTTRGRAAHGSTPQLGRNAVLAMARVVVALETRYAAALRRRRHPLLGTGTVNVGRIAGGRQPNIVPDDCTILVDRRTLPGETEAGVLRELGAFFRAQKLVVRTASTKAAACPALETPVAHPPVRAFLASLRQTRPLGVDYFCDAAVLAAGGIPSVVFGPGDIAQAHTVDEWISLRSLENGRNRLFRYLKSLP
jgi:acetylornithine deacetylase/succinyl-diaminopimelate desuccinylase-like protein